MSFQGNNRVTRKRPQRPKPPGCIYVKKDRFYWRGRMPGESVFASRPITPPGVRFALRASPENQQAAYEVVWSWWEEAAANAVSPRKEGLSLADLVAAYLAHAAGYYRRKDGEPTGETTNIEYATRMLSSSYGTSPADSIGRTEIHAVREKMIAAGLARSTINSRVNIIKRMYRWACDDAGIVAESAWYSVNVVKNLAMNRSDAREPEDVQPADLLSVAFTLPFLPATIKTMVKLHLLAGFRSTELCIMRPCDIDRSGDVWIYTPQWHKTQHLGKPRPIPMGPRAQRLLKRFLDRGERSFCFTPAEAMLQRNRRGNVVHDRYDRRSYYYAVGRAMIQARRWVDEINLRDGDEGHQVRLEHWTPHQLRHSFLTRVGNAFGAEQARVSGGHASLNATEIYLERDLEKAKDVARSMG